MTNPLLKALGITPDIGRHAPELVALFDAAWECVRALKSSQATLNRNPCCYLRLGDPHFDNCPLAAFDKAAKFFQEDV